MDTGGKRKRDSDQPRITYHTADRTFDRLFKEKSLGEMKSVVRRKLGLSPVASIHLAQLREDKRIDLEDDDDFDAFLVVIRSTSLVNVVVTWSTEPAPISTELASIGSPTTSLDPPRADNAPPALARPEPQPSGSATPKRKKRKIDLGAGIVSININDTPPHPAQGGVAVSSDVPVTGDQDGFNVLEGNTSVSALPKGIQTRPTAGSILSQRHTRSSFKIAQAAAQAEAPKRPSDTGQETNRFSIQLADAITKSSAVDSNLAKVTAATGESKDQIQPMPKRRGQSSLGSTDKKKPVRKASQAAGLDNALNNGLTGNIQKPIAGASVTSDSAQAFEDIFQKVHAAHKAMAASVSSPDPTPHPEKKVDSSPPKPSKTPPKDIPPSISHPQRDRQSKPKKGLSELATCPVCTRSPLHVRYKCPVITAGADAIEKRISELRQGKNAMEIVGGTAQLISELRAMVNKIRGPTTTVTKSSQKQPTVSGIRPIQPLPSSSSSSGSESEEPEPPPIAAGAGVGNEDISGIDLDSLIRGPIARVRVSDLVSPESSEEEPNDNRLEEESDEGVKRPKGRSFGRKKVPRHAPDSSDEGNDEQASDRDTMPSGPHLGSMTFRAVDVLGESVSMDKSGNDAANDALTQDTAILAKNGPGVSPKPQTQFTTDQAIEDTTLPRDSSTNPDASKNPLDMDVEDPIEPADDLQIPQCNSVELHAPPLDGTGDPPPTHPTASPMQSSEIAVERGNTSPIKASKVNAPADADTVKTSISSPNNLPPRARMRQPVGKRTTQPLTNPPSTKKLSKYRKSTPGPGKLSQDQPRPTPSNFKSWAILSPVVDADSSMMSDELRSSSPGGPPSLPRHDQDRSAGKPLEEPPSMDPLFIPSESQAPFPYSQWAGSIEVPNHLSPPNDQDSEDDEDEVAAAIKSRPRGKKSTSYRSLTDIASQRSLFPTPGIPQDAYPPRTRNKTLSDLYGRSTENDSDEVDSDSEVEAQSHIPASRRAGTTNPPR